MRAQNTTLNLLLGILLTGSPVVAGDESHVTSGDKTPADSIRRVSPVPLPASAKDAASATALIVNQTSGGLRPNAVATLPPLPPGVSELKFGEFFRWPIGPRGLEYTGKLRSLEGRRIRILGYMVRQEQPVPHRFMLAPRPVNLHEDEFGFCDDLPAAVLHVLIDASAPAEPPFTPGLLLLTGTLSVGNRTEPDGRVSTVRLQLDPPSDEQCRGLEAAAALATKAAHDAGPGTKPL
jgi:hypothetical protein